MDITFSKEGVNNYEIGTHIRLLKLNYYSTYTELIKYFNLTNKCDKTSKELSDFGVPYRLERIHKFWQLTEYIIKDYVLFSDYNDTKLVYHIESVDGKSNLIVPHDCIEPIKEYNSAWMIE